MRLIDWFKEKKQLIDENYKIKKGKKTIEEKYNQILDDLDEIQKKYINILEEKSEKFDLYINYQTQCEELTKDKKELKKQLADSTTIINSLKTDNEEIQKKYEKIENKIKKLEKGNTNGKQENKKPKAKRDRN